MILAVAPQQPAKSQNHQNRCLVCKQAAVNYAAISSEMNGKFNIYFLWQKTMKKDPILLNNSDAITSAGIPYCDISDLVNFPPSAELPATGILL